MPDSGRDRSRRRRASGGPRPVDHAPGYRFLERADGLRIEHPQRHAVDLRIAPPRIEIASASRRLSHSLFVSPIGLARLVAGALLGAPDTTTGDAFDEVRREIWTISRMLEPVRRALLRRHAPDFAAIEDLMLPMRGTMPRLARSPIFYRFPYLVSDVRRFRAAAIALAFLEDDLWPHRPLVDRRRPHVRELCRHMANWRGLFSPDATPYRSLDRTLMNLPDGIPPALVCALRDVRLERPIVDRLELLFLLQCLALARERRQPLPWLRALQHASAAAVVGGLERIAAATHRRTLAADDPSDVRFAATYLIDAQVGAVARFEHVISHAIRAHAGLQRGQPRGNRRVEGDHLDSLAFRRDTPVAMPPLPPPAVPGLRFLATVGEIHDEGRAMGHCIGLYAGRAVRGECFLFHAEHGGVAASVEVGADGRVHQAAGPDNRTNAAVEWARCTLAAWTRAWPARGRARDRLDDDPATSTFLARATRQQRRLMAQVEALERRLVSETRQRVQATRARARRMRTPTLH